MRRFSAADLDALRQWEFRQEHAADEELGAQSMLDYGDCEDEVEPAIVQVALDLSKVGRLCCVHCVGLYGAQLQTMTKCTREQCLVYRYVLCIAMFIPNIKVHYVPYHSLYTHTCTQTAADRDYSQAGHLV